MRQVVETKRALSKHWVGDGFPVRTLFSYDRGAADTSPFLLFDYAGPHLFEPAPNLGKGGQRGVGQHPHRGFETVTIVYDGEVAHKDSTGQGGVIGPGDVQWMTAAGGIIHEEFHSPAFSKTGGPFRMVQLWVNLPAKAKMGQPGYQGIAKADIPVVTLAEGAGAARVIAGEFRGAKGPARTATPINLWDVRLAAGADVAVDLPEGHTAMIAVLAGHVTIGAQGFGEAEIARLARTGGGVQVKADSNAILLVLTGEPIAEPVVGYGPFVMNTPQEIRQAVDDFNSGKFGRIAHA
jgi:redox-sensitive bicupin YhaK (pirin superfamily)